MNYDDLRDKNNKEFLLSVEFKHWSAVAKIEIKKNSFLFA